MNGGNSKRARRDDANVGCQSAGSTSIGGRFDNIIDSLYRYDVGIYAYLMSYLEPVDAWRVRSVCKRWYSLFEDRFWTPVPQKIDLPDEQLAGCTINSIFGNKEDSEPFTVSPIEMAAAAAAYNAVEHIKSRLDCSKSNRIKVKKDIAKCVRKSWEHDYEEIYENCVAVYLANPGSLMVVLNFLPPHGVVLPNNAIMINGQCQQLTLDVALMNGNKVPTTVSSMHAEIRVLHAPRWQNRQVCKPESIEQDMCIFCAMTWLSLEGQAYTFHPNKLKWYTFSPRIFASRAAVSTYFGNDFARVWFSSDKATKCLMLKYCVLFTNEKWFNRYRDKLQLVAEFKWE